MSLNDHENNQISKEQYKKKLQTEHELNNNGLSSPYAINPMIYKLEQTLNKIAKSKKKRNQFEGNYQIQLSQTVDIDIENQPYYYPKQNKTYGQLEPIPERQLKGPTQKYISSQNIEQYRKDQRFHKYSLCISRDVDQSKSPLDYEQQIKSEMFPSLLKEELNIKYISNYSRNNQINNSPRKQPIGKIDIEKKDFIPNKVIAQKSDKQERSDQSNDTKIKLFPSIKKDQQQFFDQNPQDAQSEKQPIEERKLKFEPINQKTPRRNSKNGIQYEQEEVLQETEQITDYNDKLNTNRAKRFNIIMVFCLNISSNIFLSQQKNYKYDNVMNEIKNMVKNFRKKQQKIYNNKQKQVSFMI